MGDIGEDAHVNRDGDTRSYVELRERHYDYLAAVVRSSLKMDLIYSIMGTYQMPSGQ